MAETIRSVSAQTLTAWELLIVDFTHLSGGNVNSDHFKAGLREFRRHWDPKFHVFLVRTPCTFFYLSRYAAVRRLLAQKPVMKLVRAGFKARRVAKTISAKK